MILSDRDIRKEVEAGRIVIEPFDSDMVQPSSIDLHVDDVFRIFANSRYPYIDVKKRMDDLTEEVRAQESEPFILHPGEFVLGSTLEKVTLPDDIVARIEGKSSLGRLGLLIHSSLPGTEQIWLLEGNRLRPRTIAEVVNKRVQGSVVGFDLETMKVAYHPITGWYEGPPDRIFEVVLASGRKLRVTGGHSLFTLDRQGMLRRVRPLELSPDDRVAIPRQVPDPPSPRDEIELLPLIPESDWRWLLVQGPSVARAFDADPAGVRDLLRTEGFRHADFYRSRARLPLPVAGQIPGLLAGLAKDDRLGFRGSGRTLPLSILVDTELAWLLGLYVAEGYRRRNQVTIANTDSAILDRADQTLVSIGLPTYRNGLHLTCCSTLFSALLEWIGAGGKARSKAVPWPVFGWGRPLLESFLEGLLDGDGSREATRNSLWTSSANLVSGMLLVAPRLGLRASVSYRERAGRPAYQVSMPHREHKLLTGIPLPDQLLVQLRREAGLSQVDAAERLGFRAGTDLNNLERRSGRTAARRSTLQRIRDGYGSGSAPLPSLPKLSRIVDGDLAWDRVAKVIDTNTTESVYDLEVRPGGAPIENFLAGFGGVFASNTAGFVDAGWSGHLTLELSNVANLPITIYPGMKIGQLCLFRMSSPAERPYGDRGKYQDQRGPTPSRFYEDFERET